MTKENFDAKVTLAAEKLKEEVEPLKECSVNAIKKSIDVCGIENGGDKI